MSLTLETIKALAPDQSSLNAASKLRPASKWPVLHKQPDQSDSGQFIWGDCQGSGSTPYRVVFDLQNEGYKCSCPSRKFPCKHALAIAWIYVERPADFSDDTLPDWVTEWNARRRGSTTPKAKADPGDKPTASMDAAALADPPKKQLTPEQQAAAAKRAEAAALKRKQQTEDAVRAGIAEFESWVDDQLRTGLQGLLDDINGRCRTMAARLVDAKAAGLAARLDELPSKVLTLPSDERLDGLLAELSMLLVLGANWCGDPTDPDARREAVRAESREQLLENADRLEVTGRWEILAETSVRRRDNLIAQTTWLLNLDGNAPQRFAMLQDFYPASQGRPGASLQSGAQFDGTLLFYPSKAPLRAIILERNFSSDLRVWPAEAVASEEAGSLFAPWLDRVAALPWTEQAPIHLSAGRLVKSDAKQWYWRGDDGLTLPCATKHAQRASSFGVARAWALYDGRNVTLLAAQTQFGVTHFETGDGK